MLCSPMKSAPHSVQAATNALPANKPAIPFSSSLKTPASRYHLRSSPNLQKRAPLFSIACTLFSIHNFAHPLSFVRTTHSLPKTPGVWCPTNSPFSISGATPTESHCFATIPHNPHRITLFHKHRGVGVPQSSFSSLRTLRPSALRPPFHTRIYLTHPPPPQPLAARPNYWSPVTVVLKSTGKGLH